MTNSKEKKNKSKKTVAIVYYSVSIVWFALAFSFMHTDSNSSMAPAYFAIAAMWLCLGGVFARRGKKEEKTLQYYNDNALNFVESTINADMSEARNKFISYLSEKALILDWGCGSGRDSLAFKEAGYPIEATDASEELCQLASEKLGQEVRCETFDELDAREEYDGIWACASLLHLEKDYIPETFDIACKALKPGGVIYASFKYGDFEGERNGRYFTDMTEERFAKSIKKIKHVELVEQWITEDVRNDRNEKWFNVILKKALLQI